MTCQLCDDGEGGCIFPFYGLAPHDHKRPFGGTVLRPKEEWPENFMEDPECPGQGMYTHCMNCGAPEK